MIHLNQHPGLYPGANTGKFQLQPTFGRTKKFTSACAGLAMLATGLVTGCDNTGKEAGKCSNLPDEKFLEQQLDKLVKARITTSGKVVNDQGRPYIDLEVQEGPDGKLKHYHLRHWGLIVPARSNTDRFSSRYTFTAEEPDGSTKDLDIIPETSFGVTRHTVEYEESVPNKHNRFPIPAHERIVREFLNDIPNTDVVTDGLKTQCAATATDMGGELAYKSIELLRKLYKLGIRIPGMEKQLFIGPPQKENTSHQIPSESATSHEEGDEQKASPNQPETGSNWVVPLLLYHAISGGSKSEDHHSSSKRTQGRSRSRYGRR